jgi:hypothetical protein
LPTSELAYFLAGNMQNPVLAAGFSISLHRQAFLLYRVRSVFTRVYFD